MLFNSFPFIFAFLPITVLGYELLRRRGLQRAKKVWLIAASCVFYAYWSAAFLGLLFVSIVVNFFVGRRLQTLARDRGTSSRRLLIIGLIWNLSLLGYFKYANFFIDNFDAAFGLHIEIARIVLPLGISFFTFQKVAFLVDSYRNKVEPHTFIDFALFVMFFPQLIAGPIVHFGEVIRQFSQPTTPPATNRYAIGVTVFAMGLAKKVLVADTLAIHAGAFFDAAAGGYAPGMLEAWIGMLCYTLQIYFDFSGYSDMAIGLAWMFGVKLPINFASPYKAQSIAEYWQRWHVTLSRFLRDYIYIPLGGNRRGATRQNVNLMTTMLHRRSLARSRMDGRAVGCHARRDARHSPPVGAIEFRRAACNASDARHVRDVRMCAARFRHVSRGRSRNHDGNLPGSVRFQWDVVLAGDVGDRNAPHRRRARALPGWSPYGDCRIHRNGSDRRVPVSHRRATRQRTSARASVLSGGPTDATASRSRFYYSPAS